MIGIFTIRVGNNSRGAVPTCGRTRENLEIVIETFVQKGCAEIRKIVKWALFKLKLGPYFFILQFLTSFFVDLNVFKIPVLQCLPQHRIIIFTCI